MYVYRKHTECWIGYVIKGSLIYTYIICMTSLNLSSPRLPTYMFIYIYIADDISLVKLCIHERYVLHNVLLIVAHYDPNVLIIVVKLETLSSVGSYMYIYAICRFKPVGLLIFSTF